MGLSSFAHGMQRAAIQPHPLPRHADPDTRTMDDLVPTLKTVPRSSIPQDVPPRFETMPLSYCKDMELVKALSISANK